MWQLWKARRARRAALRAIAPLVAGTRLRLDGIADRAWSDPYVVGFLAMLATLAAERRVGGLSPDILGLVQAETLAAIAGLPADTLGERIFTLSAAGDHRFEIGRCNALLFAAGAPPLPEGGAAGEPATALDSRDLWIACFDRQLPA